MGLFSRKESASSRHQSRPRPSVSSEAQAASMRVRARRRLAGAVALVLAAVIVLPMLLDSEPKPIPASIEVAIPARNTPFEPNLSPAQEVAASSASGQVESAPDQASPRAVEPVAIPQAQPASAGSTSTEKPQPESAASATAPVSSAPPKPTPQQRTDDGSRALALLEGRAPTSGSASRTESGYVVQVASYSTQGDANSRRDKLRSEGVTNAFVESTNVNGKPTFRLRVGPFGSRDAAQAAQTRLRALGYPNGFIATQ